MLEYFLLNSVLLHLQIIYLCKFIKIHFFVIKKDADFFQHKKYDYFYDKRGFLIFSENINDAIDKTSAKRNDAGYKEYKSFNTVDASMKALQMDVNTCHVDMQKDNSIICD